MVQTSDETAPQSLLTPSVQDENRKNRSSEESNEMVTLTKTQLRAILEALSQVGTSFDVKPEHAELHLEDSSISGKLITGGRRQQNERSSIQNRTSSCEDITVNSELISNGIQKIVHVSPMSQATSNAKPIGVSRIEQKRRQWAKERAEMEEWNPWGKPGAGAPRPRRSSISSSFPRVESRTDRAAVDSSNGTSQL